MNTSLTQVDSVNAILKVEINKADYQDKVNDRFKLFPQKATLKLLRK